MSLPVVPGIEVIEIDEIRGLADRLRRQRRYFTLLLACDSSNIPQSELHELFRPLADNGLAYFCAWGRGCEAVHDAVDSCIVEEEMRCGEADYLLMTTWHSDEPLDEAAWFFKMLAIPSENHVFADFERFAVSVGNAAWAEEMRRLFSAETSGAEPLAIED